MFCRSQSLRENRHVGWAPSWDRAVSGWTAIPGGKCYQFQSKGFNGWEGMGKSGPSNPTIANVIVRKSAEKLVDNVIKCVVCECTKIAVLAPVYR